ncbi:MULTISPECIES: GNAT family N-acetyltransferase [Kitasatospora]|uniref:Putative acetyltransferase n=1 Tax=Kitasatospora setae (strain ATCC 33774 / DSM 43861 / JCM 3304 / KCC A-0304 / NBRC 14216 / KM-6054) TaxID=452652 RepID=E4NGS7_KITSK|nr:MULTISPECIES: GNAT family N-acetyltransferase [Kitasatospora]BAJ30707.1 putative acetyltransferase [Kitasatospora setae KM-6054]
MQPPIVRRALVHDLAGAGEVSVAAFVGDGHTRPDSPYVELLRDAARRDREAELLVAVDGSGAVLGCVTFAPGGTPWADTAGPGEGEIRMLAVGPAARGRGVGRALVEASIARSRELGLGGMAFSTRPAMTAAHRIYEALGFVRTPERDWSPVPGTDLMVYTMRF